MVQWSHHEHDVRIFIRELKSSGVSQRDARNCDSSFLHPFFCLCHIKWQWIYQVNCVAHLCKPISVGSGTTPYVEDCRRLLGQVSRYDLFRSVEFEALSVLDESVLLHPGLVMGLDI